MKENTSAGNLEYYSKTVGLLLLSSLATTMYVVGWVSEKSGQFLLEISDRINGFVDRHKESQKAPVKVMPRSHSVRKESSGGGSNKITDPAASEEHPDVAEPLSSDNKDPLSTEVAQPSTTIISDEPTPKEEVTTAKASAVEEPSVDVKDDPEKTA